MRDYSALAANPFRDFVFPHYIGRVEYIVRTMAWNVLLWIPFYLLVRGWIADEWGAGDFYIALTVLPVLLVAIYVTVRATIVPRLRDLQWNAYFAWLVVIPYVNAILALLLMIMPGRSRIKPV